MIPRERRARFPRGGVAALAAAGVVLAVGVSAAVLAGPRAPEAVDPAALLTARERALALRLELAKADRMYLLLEADRGALTLYHGAAAVRVWPVSEVASGERRLGAGRGARRPLWRSTLWEEARIEPEVRRERRVIVSDQVEPPDLTGAVEWVPPTPEEEVPTPERFVVRFSGGMGLEVRVPGADTLAYRPGLLRRAGASLARLSPTRWDRYRIRVVMDPVEGGALYRSLPEGIAFTAVLPD